MGAPMARKKAAKKAATRRIAKKATADLFAWKDPVAAMHAALQTLENQVAQGDLATPSLKRSRVPWTSCGSGLGSAHGDQCG